MQNPPPGPPPGGQPPYQPPGPPPPGYPAPSAAGGIDKKTGAILSYLLWWITGIIFLFVGKNDPDVKYHAAQSTIFFGAVFILDFVINRISLVSGGVGILFGILAFALWVFAVVVWVMCLVRASSGGGTRFEIPWVGGVITPYAEQLANAVN
jgi:uncharacterized membrane protein